MMIIKNSEPLWLLAQLFKGRAQVCVLVIIVTIYVSACILTVKKGLAELDPVRQEDFFMWKDTEAKKLFTVMNLEETISLYSNFTNAYRGGSSVRSIS